MLLKGASVYKLGPAGLFTFGESECRFVDERLVDELESRLVGEGGSGNSESERDR